jgi:FtsH-binding integral membrane protein
MRIKYISSRYRKTYVWKILAGALIGAVIITVFLMPPPLRIWEMCPGFSFFHTPLAWVAILAFFVLMVNAILFLKRNEIGYDMQAVHSVEIF